MWKYVVLDKVNEYFDSRGRYPDIEDIFLDICQVSRASHYVPPSYGEVEAFMFFYERVRNIQYLDTITVTKSEFNRYFCEDCGLPASDNASPCKFCLNKKLDSRLMMLTVGWI